MSYVRYHLDTGYNRTTVSLDDTIAELLALMLGVAPDADETHAVVREWLQKTVDQYKHKGKIDGQRLSYYARRWAILALVDARLAKKHFKWLGTTLDDG